MSVKNSDSKYNFLTQPFANGLPNFSQEKSENKMKVDVPGLMVYRVFFFWF